ncbi:MAG: hypothetical protein ACRD5J_04220 [Nitrososphaeraceae archaeon]
MGYHKSLTSKTKERPKVDPNRVQDDLEEDIQKIINEDQIDIEKKFQPIFTAVRLQRNNGNMREDVAKKYEVFLKSVSQVMKAHNIISINIGYFVDPYSVNSPNYAVLELTPQGVIANHCDRTIEVENVLDVLYDLQEPEQILRSLIYKIVEETKINKKWISELESSLEFAERAIRSSKDRSTEADNPISGTEE